MKLSKSVNPTRCWQLLAGVVGIYTSYFIAAVIPRVHVAETIARLKMPYENDIISD
jgi:hypothetical protein